MPKASELPKLAYSIQEAIQVTSLSKTTLYELINAGILKSVKIGGRMVIPAPALEALVNDGLDVPAYRSKPDKST